MALQSMTGFARSEGTAADGALTWVWELRSVNGKGLDLRLRLPQGFEGLEPRARKMAAGYVARGNINVALTVSTAASADTYSVNDAFLDRLIALAADKAADLPANVGMATLDGLLAVKGVIETKDTNQLSDDDRASRDADLIDGLSKAFTALVDARRDEGQHLEDLLSGQLKEIAGLAQAARDSAASQPDALKARLKANVDALLDASPALPEERLAQEAALLAQKADVREELDRLDAHVEQGKALLVSGEPCGRRLEFLSQEFNREANTLCSKSSDADLTKIGLDLKAVIDQFREQIQNVE